MSDQSDGSDDIHVNMDTIEVAQLQGNDADRRTDDGPSEARRRPGVLSESQGDTISSGSAELQSFHTPAESPSATQPEDAAPTTEDETVPVVIRPRSEGQRHDGASGDSQKERTEEFSFPRADDESGSPETGARKTVVEEGAEDEDSVAHRVGSPAVTWAGPHDEPWHSPSLDDANLSRSAPVSRGVSPAATPPRPRSLRDAFGASTNRFPRQRGLLLPPMSPRIPSHTPGDSRAHALCSYEYVGDAALERLLERQPRDANAPNAEGSTPLHLAASCGYVVGVELLLQAGADANARDADGKTPVHDAATAGHGGEAVLEVLLQAGADANAADRDGWAPLHRAAAMACLPEVSAAACAAVGTLLAQGADPWQRQEDPARPRGCSGDTALHVAAAGGSFPCVERLVEAMGGGGYQEALGEEKETPGDAAARAGHMELSQWLRTGISLSSPDESTWGEDGAPSFPQPPSARTDESEEAAATGLRRERYAAGGVSRRCGRARGRASLRSQLARWKSQARWERERREAAEADKARLQVELDAVRSAWERLEKTHEQQRMELEAWEATWTAEQRQWNARWEQVQEEHQRRAEAHQAAEARVVSLQRSCEALRHELESARQEAQHAQQTAPALQQRIARLEKEISVATDRVATLEHSQQETKRVLDDARERNRDLRAALHASRSYVRALEEELATQRVGDSDDAVGDEEEEDEGENEGRRQPSTEKETVRLESTEDTLQQLREVVRAAGEDGSGGSIERPASVGGGTEPASGAGGSMPGRRGQIEDDDTEDDDYGYADASLAVSRDRSAWEWVDDSREWVRCWTGEGVPYYYNTVTEESAWELPRQKEPEPLSSESRHMAVWNRFFANALAGRQKGTERKAPAVGGANGRASDPEVDRRAVFAALRRRDAESVRALFLQGSLPSPATCWNHPPERKTAGARQQHALTVLHVAAWCADLASLQVMSEVDPEGLVDVDVEDTHGNTPLHLAAAACASAVLRSSRKLESGSKRAAMHGSESDAVACLDFLLGCAADATKQNRTGETALHLAAAGGSIAAVERLLGYMSTPSLRLQAESGETALERAQTQRWLAPEIGVPLQRVIRRLRQAERQEHPSRVAEALLFRGEVSREEADKAALSGTSTSSSSDSDDEAVENGDVGDRGSWLGGWARRLGSLLQATSAGGSETPEDSAESERKLAAPPPRDEDVPNRDEIRPQRIRANAPPPEESVAPESPLSRIRRPSLRSDDTDALSPRPRRSRGGRGMESPTSVSSADREDPRRTPSAAVTPGGTPRRTPQRRRAARWMALQQGSPPVRLSEWGKSTRGPAGRSHSDAQEDRQPSVWVPTSLLAKEAVVKARNPYGPAPDDGDVRDRISSDSADNSSTANNRVDHVDDDDDDDDDDGDVDGDGERGDPECTPGKGRLPAARRLRRFFSEPGRGNDSNSSPATPRGTRGQWPSVTVDAAAQDGPSTNDRPASPSGSASSSASGIVFFNPSTASGSARTTKGKQWMARVRSPSLRERYVDSFPASPRPGYDSEH